MERICVGALVVRGDGEPQLLLGKRAANRAFYPDVWDVPGGHSEPGETAEQTLVRELEEEIGVTPTAWRSLGELRERVPESGELLTVRLYVVTAWTGTPTNRLPAEHAEIAWFGVEDACRLELAHPAYPALFRRAVAVIAGADVVSSRTTAVR
jgi:8-oxo-dGTP diphosphatase